jgi:hypothetical protein
MIAEASTSIKRVLLLKRHSEERSDDLSAVALAKAEAIHLSAAAAWIASLRSQ